MEFFTPGHLIVLAVVLAALYFGGSKIPEMSKSAGKSLRIFRSEMRGHSEDDEPAADVVAEPKGLGVPAQPAAIAPAAPQTDRPRPRPTPGPRSTV